MPHSSSELAAVDALIKRLSGTSDPEQARNIVLSAMDVQEKVDYDSFVNGMWFYSAAAHGGMPELGYAALALCGESGEVAEKVKKAYREANGVVDREAMRKELGDVLFYLTKLAHLIDFNLSDVAEGNMQKLRDRQERGKMHGSGDNR